MPSGEASSFEKGVVGNVMEIANERGDLEWRVAQAQALIPDVLSIAKMVGKISLQHPDQEPLLVSGLRARHIFRIDYSQPLYNC
ncbi:MAG: hypothetical protein KDD67_17055 [Ignavibacteriae bacterium]|nr:hypothetical protein [Ignavibacteriota bacterium]